MQGKYLGETLTSVQNQILQNWECIVVNDGSVDETEIVANTFCNKDSRFKYIYQDNAGVSAARNNGLGKALGKYIQFLDGDDILQPNKIAAQVEFLNTHPRVAIVYGSNRYFFDGNILEIFSIHPNGFPPSIEMDYEDKHQIAVILKRNVSTICATLYRKEVFNHIKFRPVVFEDHLLHIECAFNNFRFHYEKNQNAFCLIRITTESQMQKHVVKNNKTNEFDLALNTIIEKYKYVSPFETYYRNNISNMKQSLSRRILNNLLPPVVFKFFNILNNNIKIKNLD